MPVRPSHKELPGLSLKVEDEKNDKKSVKQNNRWFCVPKTLSSGLSLLLTSCFSQTGIEPWPCPLSKARLSIGYNKMI